MRWRNDGYASESERTLTALYIEVGAGSSEVDSTQLLVRLKDFLDYETDSVQIIKAQQMIASPLQRNHSKLT